MIEGFFKFGKFKETCALFLSLPVKGVQIDLRIYNVMIYELRKKSMIAKAEMVVSKLIPMFLNLIRTVNKTTFWVTGSTGTTCQLIKICVMYLIFI